MTKIAKDIIENGRQVELKNMWLLYNFERFTDFFWTRKSAWEEAYGNNFDRDDTKEIYQVLRGDIKITLHKKHPKL